MPGPITGAAGKLWLRIHDHVGSAIRALNEEIAQLTARTSTITMVSVFVFLIAEVSLPSVSVGSFHLLHLYLHRATTKQALLSGRVANLITAVPIGLSSVAIPLRRVFGSVEAPRRHREPHQ